MNQLSLFELDKPRFKITKPIRLIELFAGIGSQAMVPRDLGADFEHHRVVEFDRFAIASYNAIHGTNFTTMDITKISETDLGIEDTDKYTYIMTYSFPCQDLSVAGKQRGMTKGTGTRSGLLWEVERLLNETENLPQVLLMENVKQVIGKKNLPDFKQWLSFLESKGYSNYYKVLNAKDYGVAQNRERCFMVSILGDYSYEFPEPIPLTKRLKDYLEDEVDEKYYINTEKAQKLIQQLMEKQSLNGCIGNVNPSGNGINGNVYKQDIANTLTTNKGEGPKYAVEQLGNYMESKNFDNPQCGRVYSTDGLSPTLNTMCGGDRQPKIVAMRGRNPENPTSRQAGLPTEQRLEINESGICNCLTTVQKDSLVLEPNVLTPKRTEYGKQIRKAYENHEIQESRHNMTELEPRKDGVCNTLTTLTKDNYVCEPVTTRGNDYASTIRATYYKNGERNVIRNMENSGGYEGVIEPTIIDDMYENRGPRQYTDYAPALRSERSGLKTFCEYRIRKLTPKECFRLMSFTDEDFHKAESVNSNSQLYKEAGNAICKCVLMAIFQQML